MWHFCAAHLEFPQLFQGLFTVLVGHIDARLQLLQVQLKLLTCGHSCRALLPLILQLHLHLPNLQDAEHVEKLYLYPVNLLKIKLFHNITKMLNTECLEV